MTDDELKYLERLSEKDEPVKNLLEEYKSFKTDPAKKFYLQLNSVIDALTDDLNSIVNRGDKPIQLKLITNEKEDKIFERVKVLLLDSETIFKGLKYARENIMPELKENEKDKEMKEGMSAVDRIASKTKTK